MNRYLPFCVTARNALQISPPATAVSDWIGSASNDDTTFLRLSELAIIAASSQNVGNL